MVEKKLEITSKLEKLAVEGTLNSKIAILNLPSANFCEKRAEKIEVGEVTQQSCLGCVTQGITTREAIGIGEVMRIIDYFAEQHGTRFITINGRGDPFHPKVADLNTEKIKYAHERYGLQAYVFTAGNNLDEKLCRFLVDHESNVMISLFGNKFIDADFFSGRKYSSSPKPLQDCNMIATNLRRLIVAYAESKGQPEAGTTRIGMNYVIDLSDLKEDGKKVSALKEVANDHGLFFVCNTHFVKHPDQKIQQEFEHMADQYSNFHLRHSTAVNGQCQMGAGSGATVDFDGTLLRCPYMSTLEGDGKFRELSLSERERVVDEYMHDRSYPCVMRKHQT